MGEIQIQKIQRIVQVKDEECNATLRSLVEESADAGEEEKTQGIFCLP